VQEIRVTVKVIRVTQPSNSRHSAK
jgi:hypothetical protein